MRKINDLGRELICFHEELKKDYPEIVKKSLIATLERMASNDVIDYKAFELLQDEKTKKEDLLLVLSNNKRYVKNNEELFEEYEEVRKELDKTLREINLSKLSTETKVEKDEIYVCKTFTINKIFVINYFGVEEAEIPKLMSRKGFIETFVALRLVKVLGDIIAEGSRAVKKVNLSHSLAYIDESGEKYNIDLVTIVKIDDLDIEEEKVQVMEDIKKVEAISERVYEQKMKR